MAVSDSKVIIIGGGASGLMLRHLLPSSLLIEKNSRCGLKLLITGNGACNITHDEEAQSFVTHYNGKKNFVSPAVYSFPPRKIREFFSSAGVDTFIRDDGKVFPSSKRSEDIRNALLGDDEGILYDTAVRSIRKDGEIFTVETDRGVFTSKIVVIATGGMTYPKTGSTGDGYRFASAFGHTVIPTHTALAPVRIDADTSYLEGVSLESVTLKAGREKEHGPVVFTRRGLGGPAAENISRFIPQRTELTISFLDSFNAEDIKKENGKAGVLTSLHRITSLPSSLLEYLFPMLMKKNTASVTKEEMRIITDKLTDWKVRAEAESSLEKAMVTSGGVDTSEIEKKTMESKIVENLYFTGEVLDVDGECGGYNLTFAFASAYLAAQDIRKKI